MARDPLRAHARDELGITEEMAARPIQAGLASAASFIVGAALPLLATAVSPLAHVGPIVVGSTLVVLAGLGALAAVVGGASLKIGAGRVVLWGALAMGITAAVGALFWSRCKRSYATAGGTRHRIIATFTASLTIRQEIIA